MSANVEIGPMLGRVATPLIDRAATTHSWIWKWYRRELVGRVRRATRWEFWPPWAFYPPVVTYLFYLGLKHRNLTLFTAVNPAIPDGGFIGESKYEILRALERSFSVPKTILLNPNALDTRAALIESFMRREGLTFPIVLKPDAGGGVLSPESEPAKFIRSNSGVNESWLMRTRPARRAFSMVPVSESCVPIWARMPPGYSSRMP